MRPVKAFILSVVVVLCASTELRGSVEIEHLTDARARGIVKVWWDANARKQFLERLSLGESNFVAVCVGDTKLVCSMPVGYADDASARGRMDAMRRHHDMGRDIRRNDFERDDDSKWLTEKASNAFSRAQCERDALVRFAEVGSQKTAKEWGDLRRKEEFERLERLLDRFSRNEDAMFRGKGENTRRAWEEVSAEMRKRGVSETHIELMRHDRELREDHHREFMPHERMGRNRMLREEVREFERWLEMRVSEDRRGAQRDLKKSVLKRQNTLHNQESRIRNGKEMAAQIAKTEEKKKAEKENESERVCGADVLVFAFLGTVLIFAVMRIRKNGIAGERYDAQNRNLQPCAYCGQMLAVTHPIYHSVIHAYHVVARERASSQCGFAIYTCDACLKKHKRGLLLSWTIEGIWFVSCVVLGHVISSVVPNVAVQCLVIFVAVGVGVCGLLFASRRLMGRFRPWHEVAREHPAVAALLKMGYGFDDGWPRYVRGDSDTQNIQREVRHYRKYNHGVVHEKYEWLGVVSCSQNVRARGADENVSKLVGALREHDEKMDSLRAASAQFSFGYIVLVIVLVSFFSLLIYLSMSVAEKSGNAYVGMAVAVGLLLVVSVVVRYYGIGVVTWFRSVCASIHAAIVKSQYRGADGKKDERIRHSTPLEDVPNGVSVSALNDSSGYRIVYRRRRISRILLGFLWMLASGLFLVHSCYSISHLKELYVSFCVLFFVSGCFYLLRELFGKDVLELKPKEGSYAEEGRMLWGRRENFPLSAITRIRYRKRHDFMDIECRDIVIKNEELEEIALGSSLPEEVQDYFVLCMSSWKGGRPPIVSHGRTWHVNIAHPFLFAIFALATAFCLSYALSCQERVLVRDGKISISETDLWGRSKTVAEIPTCDVASLLVHEWHGGRGSVGRTLRIKGHDSKVIAEIGSLDVKADEYARGMRMALKGTDGVMFDRKRNNAGWSWLFVCLLWFVAIGFCGDGENRPKKVDGRND